jgi:hypothetical protein
MVLAKPEPGSQQNITRVIRLFYKSGRASPDFKQPEHNAPVEGDVLHIEELVEWSKAWKFTDATEATKRTKTSKASQQT